LVSDEYVDETHLTNYSTCDPDHENASRLPPSHNGPRLLGCETRAHTRQGCYDDPILGSVPSLGGKSRLIIGVGILPFPIESSDVLKFRKDRVSLFLERSDDDEVC
jgi:hypothetical protein